MKKKFTPLYEQAIRKKYSTPVNVKTPSAAAVRATLDLTKPAKNPYNPLNRIQSSGGILKSNAYVDPATQSYRATAYTTVFSPMNAKQEMDFNYIIRSSEKKNGEKKGPS